MSRIEQLISDIESYIDTCKYYPLSNVKILPCMPGIPGMQKYKTISGKDRSSVSCVWKRSCYPQNKKGKKVLWM